VGSFEDYYILTNYECQVVYQRSQSTGAKFRWARGKHPRSSDKVPKSMLSGKGSEISNTARRFAQRQQSFKECVTAHWSRNLAPIM